MAVFIKTLDLGTLPKCIVIKKTPSLIFTAVYIKGKNVFQDKYKWQCIQWLQDNPTIIEFAKLSDETGISPILGRKRIVAKPVENKGWGHLL